MSDLLGADDAIWLTVKVGAEAMNIADCWPTTIPMPETMMSGLGGPFTLGEASAKWYEAADKLQQAQQRFRAMTGGVPRDYWDGDDRANFDKEVGDLAAEIGISHNYAMAVAITLTALAVPIGLWPAMCLTISAIEIAEAVAFYAAVASVVGDLGASEAIYAEGEAVSASCASVLDASASVLTAVMAAGTAAIAISDGADLGAQSAHGNAAALTDFTKAAIDSAPEAALTAFLAKEPRSPGRHERVPGQHRAEPGPLGKAAHDRDAQEKVKDKAGEQANDDAVVPGLSSLINKIIPDDYPAAEDENWGADGSEESGPGGR